MRYLGNKTKLLSFIESVIEKYNIQGEIFADIFSGTASVSDYFKDRYSIIANDYMTFASVISKAKLLNSKTPRFSMFKRKYDSDPFEWLNNREYTVSSEYFIYNNYTPVGQRMFFTESNAIKIDGIRLDLEELYKNNDINEKEYYFLLASLLESVLKVSNTSGTYQAFFKFWENRALKEFELIPLEMNNKDLHGNNTIYCEDTNTLIRRISGDIAYIDPPYTTNQYTNSYHVLETIAKYDNPEIFGKTGRRSSRTLSNYSNKQKAIYEFEDLFRQINFKHILISYSNQSIISLEEIVELAKKFAVGGVVHVETHNYREYATNNLSYKGNGESLKEAIIYFVKDNRINKSPLNYSGSKDVMLPSIAKYLPKHIGVMVDAMGGAFNVGANVVAMDEVVYNEYNKYVYDIVEWLLGNNPNETIQQIESIIDKFHLKKKDKEAYINFRDYYNNQNSAPYNLFVLQIYAFQNMIRFNSNQKMNTPVGNNEYCEGVEERIKNFRVKTAKYQLICDDYKNLLNREYLSDTLFYFDPPYFITTAEYNDGKRGLEGWNAKKEAELLQTLTLIDQLGYKFMLSNIVKHNGKTHHMLVDWVNEHKYRLYELGKTGIKYPREEVIITNYNPLD